MALILQWPNAASPFRNPLHPQPTPPRTGTERSNITKFGWDIILKQVIKDINLLATKGIKILSSDGTITYWGTLVLMLGESLGSHKIGGLTENFSTSKNFCRFCEILHAELRANDYLPKKYERLKLMMNVFVQR